VEAPVGDLHAWIVWVVPFSMLLVALVVYPAWRVSVGHHLDTARDVDELYATIATRLSALEAERAREGRP
jgi:hypothetical protein